MEAKSSRGPGEGSGRLGPVGSYVSVVVMIGVLMTPIALGQTSAAHAQRGVGLQSVCADLRASAEAFQGRVGFVAVDLVNGERCEYGESESFLTASLYKLVVLAEAYDQESRGEFSFDEEIVVRPEHTIDDAPELRLTQPIAMSAREALRRMIQVSDNGTAHALRERLGMSRVAAATARLGMPDTVLGADFFTTATDIVSLLGRLDAGTVVSPEASREMLGILRGQQIVDRIPFALPDDVLVANKTGNLYQNVHDAGIVYAPGGRYAVAMLTEADVSVDFGYELIRELSALTFEAYREPLVPFSEWIAAEIEPFVGEPTIAAGAAAGGSSESADASERDSEAPGTPAAGGTSDEATPVAGVEQTGGAASDAGDRSANDGLGMEEAVGLAAGTAAGLGAIFLALLWADRRRHATGRRTGS